MHFLIYVKILSFLAIVFELLIRTSSLDVLYQFSDLDLVVFLRESLLSDWPEHLTQMGDRLGLCAIFMLILLLSVTVKFILHWCLF